MIFYKSEIREDVWCGVNRWGETPKVLIEKVDRNNYLVYAPGKNGTVNTTSLAQAKSEGEKLIG